MRLCGYNVSFRSAVAAIVLAGAGMLALRLLIGDATSAAGHDRVRVGLYENEPKIHQGPDGRAEGLFAELLAEMAAREGWALDYVPCHWNECLAALRRGDLDLMPDVAITEARSLEMAFHAVPVVQAWSQIYAPRQSGLWNFGDLAEQRIALLRGSVHDDYLRERMADMGLNYTAVHAESMNEVLALVAGDEADAGVTNNFFGRRHAATYDLAETPITFGQASVYFAAPKDGRTPLLEAIDRYLTTWKGAADSPYYPALRAAMTPPRNLASPAWLWPVLASAAALVVVLAASASLLRWRVRQRTRELRDSHRRLNHLLDSSPVILYSLRGGNLRPEWVSGNIHRILGFTPEAALREGWWKLHVHPEDRGSAERESRNVLENRHATLEYRVFDSHGKVRYVRDEKQLVPASDARSEPEIIGSWTDLTSSHEQQEQLRMLANYDPRTGLPNRALLQDRIDHSMDRARAGAKARLVVLIDLDRFRSVNETMGTSVGDQVLQATAERLGRQVGTEDTVARVGSDEFCLLVESDERVASADTFLDALVSAFHAPLDIGGHDLVLTVSVGVATYPDDGASRDELISAAELALDAMRSAGGDGWRRFEPGLGEHNSHRLFLEHDLRRALSGDEFVVHYQPQLRLADGALDGAESLVRWQHPERGMIPPGEFIPLAEEVGVIRQIDEKVLSTACQQLARWDREGALMPRISVNLSKRKLHDESLVTTVRELLAQHRLSPARLEIEITESHVMEFPDRAVKVLSGFADLGVKLAMDDFGTGYSNLAYLRRLPLHRLKIDQSFVRDIGTSRHNESIVRAIIALARTLDLELVAEGIETPEQRDFLRREGCHVGQGFLLGHPVCASAFFRPDPSSRAADAPWASR